MCRFDSAQNSWSRLAFCSEGEPLNRSHHRLSLKLKIAPTNTHTTHAVTDERGGVGVLSGVVVVVGTYLPVPDSTLRLIRHEPRCIVSGWLQNVTDTVPIPTPRNSLFRVFRWSVVTVAELRRCVKVVLGSPVLNSPDGLCGRKAATLNSNSDGTARELCESRGTVAVLGSLSLDIPYDPSGHLKQHLK